jgi:hypothetical protein
MLAVCCVPTRQTLTLTTYLKVRIVHMKNIPDDKHLHSLILPTPVQKLEVHMEFMLAAPHFSSLGCETGQTFHSRTTHKYTQSCNM